MKREEIFAAYKRDNLFNENKSIPLKHAIYGWHSCADDLKLATYGNKVLESDREVASGYYWREDQFPLMTFSGLHVGFDLCDMLAFYSKGLKLCRVKCWGNWDSNFTTLGAFEYREVLWIVDLKPLVKQFVEKVINCYVKLGETCYKSERELELLHKLAQFLPDVLAEAEANSGKPYNNVLTCTTKRLSDVYCYYYPSEARGRMPYLIQYALKASDSLQQLFTYTLCSLSGLANDKVVVSLKNWFKREVYKLPRF